MKVTKKNLTLLATYSFLLSLVFASNVLSATIEASSCSYADVSAAVSAANIGDTVVVPSGNCTWSSTLVITEGITLQGAGSGVDGTVITSAITPGYYNYMIRTAFTNPGNNEAFRVTGFRFDGNWNSGIFFLSNSNATGDQVLTNVRIDNNYFTNCGNTTYPARGILVGGLVYGVADNNEFVDNQTVIDFSTCSNSEGGQEVCWDNDPDMGGANSFYFEDNTISHSHANSERLSAAGAGGRGVFRYNTITDIDQSQVLEHHANKADNLGTVSMEVYGNDFTYLHQSNNWYEFERARGGTTMVYNNTVVTPNPSTDDIFIKFQEEDDTEPYPALYQLKDAFYWNSNLNGSNVDPTHINANDATHIQQNRDYWLPSYGTEANLPSTCTADGNTYYGTTDEPYTLYKCTATDTWTVHYTRYTYPHPLRNPKPPTNLRIIQ